MATITIPEQTRHVPEARDARPIAGEHSTDSVTVVPDLVDIWGNDSFPASDAPANW